jgi:uncharacterized membrane protein
MSYDKFLKDSIQLIVFLNYTIVVIIILISVIRAIYYYIKYFKYGSILSSVSGRIILGEAVSLALSFILSVEILRFFYVQSYKQLVIVVSFVFLKILINYFLQNQIKNDSEILEEKHIKV